MSLSLGIDKQSKSILIDLDVSAHDISAHLSKSIFQFKDILFIERHYGRLSFSSETPFGESYVIAPQYQMYRVPIISPSFIVITINLWTDYRCVDTEPTLHSVNQMRVRPKYGFRRQFPRIVVPLVRSVSVV